jgi:hypothetical protein
MENIWNYEKEEITGKLRELDNYELPNCTIHPLSLG